MSVYFFRVTLYKGDYLMNTKALFSIFSLTAGLSLVPAAVNASEHSPFQEIVDKAMVASQIKEIEEQILAELFSPSPNPGELKVLRAKLSAARLKAIEVEEALAARPVRAIVVEAAAKAAREAMILAEKEAARIARAKATAMASLQKSQPHHKRKYIKKYKKSDVFNW